MIDTAGTVIKDALFEITVQGVEAPIEPSEAQGAVRYLNRMMASLDARGIDLGFTDVTNLASPITVPLGAVEGMIFLLATRLWTQYSDGSPIPSDLVQKANEGIKAMLALAVRVGPTQFPSTLPIGSGNEQSAHRDSHFYPDLQDEILAETTGSIGLETDTADETP